MITPSARPSPPKGGGAPRRQRKRPHADDLYKERNRVENFFKRIKHCRRIATRWNPVMKAFCENFVHAHHRPGKVAATAVLIEWNIFI